MGRQMKGTNYQPFSHPQAPLRINTTSSSTRVHLGINSDKVWELVKAWLVNKWDNLLAMESRDPFSPRISTSGGSSKWVIITYLSKLGRLFPTKNSLLNHWNSRQQRQAFHPLKRAKLRRFFKGRLPPLMSLSPTSTTSKTARWI